MTILNQFTHDLEAAAVRLRKATSRKDFIKILKRIRDNTSIVVDLSLVGPENPSLEDLNQELPGPYVDRKETDQLIGITKWSWE